LIYLIAVGSDVLQINYPNAVAFLQADRALLERAAGGQSADG
jgi:hypothetical protein